MYTGKIEDFSKQIEQPTVARPWGLDFKGHWDKCMELLRFTSDGLRHAQACGKRLYEELPEAERLENWSFPMGYRYLSAHHEGIRWVLEEKLSSDLDPQSPEGIALAYNWYVDTADSVGMPYDCGRVIKGCHALSDLYLFLMESLYPEIAWRIYESPKYPDPDARSDYGHFCVGSECQLYVVDPSFRDWDAIGNEISRRAEHEIKRVGNLHRYALLLAGAPPLSKEKYPFAGSHRDDMAYRAARDCLRCGMPQSDWLMFIKPQLWYLFTYYEGITLYES